MQQTEILPQQSLQTIANWGMAFSSRPDEEKELIQMYGKSLYDGALAFSSWWQSLSIGQVQAINQIDFPYWTLDAAKKLSQVPLNSLNSCLDTLQKAQLSVGKLSRILNKFIAPKKLSFGRAVTSDDWDLIARSFNLDALAIDALRQKALQMNGGSTQSLTTDLVIEILTERGDPVAQILPKPRIKRLPLPEVEQLIAIKVQEAVQDREEHLLAALERSRYLESENERLRTQLNVSISETIVDITPITEELEQPDVFDECLKLWEAFQIGERVRVNDNTNNDYYGCVGEILGLDDQENHLWGVRLPNGDYQQFPASALEQIPQSQASLETSIPLSELVRPKVREVEQVPLAG